MRCCFASSKENVKIAGTSPGSSSLKVEAFEVAFRSTLVETCGPAADVDTDVFEIALRFLIFGTAWSAAVFNLRFRGPEALAFAPPTAARVAERVIRMVYTVQFGARTRAKNL